MSKQAIENATRLNAFHVWPEDLMIVTDPKHFLYDERVKLPLDENMVRNIMAFGVKEAILINKDGDNLLVVNGRQRTTHAVEANKRLREQGKEAMKVKVLLEKGTEADLFGITAFTNEFRRDDSPIGKAAKAQKLIDLGKTEEEVRVVFGVSKATLDNWLALNNASAPVRKAVEGGRVSATAAAAIAQLPREQQEPELEKAIAAGTATVRETRIAVQKAKGKDVKERPGLPELKAAYLALGHGKSTHEREAARTVLAWVLGERKTPPDTIKDALAAEAEA